MTKESEKIFMKRVFILIITKIYFIIKHKKIPLFFTKRKASLIIYLIYGKADN